MNSSNSSNSSNGGVILKPPVVKQISPSKHWVFTFNNYTEEDLIEISSKVPELCDKYIIGKEIGESGTPHLQGFVSFKKKCRPKPLFSDRIHWEKKHKNSSLTDNLNYCSKDGQVFLSKGMPRPLIKVTYDMLRPWQKELVERYREFEDPLFGRQIHWYWESKGGIGKSILCKYFIDQMDALVISGNQNDIKHGIATWIQEHEEAPPIVILNIPRSSEGYISYPALEQIKDGFFYSGKYESKPIRFNSPHLICFANHEPDESQLSRDRWKIQCLRIRYKTGEFMKD